jgi:hypothetical protein
MVADLAEIRQRIDHIAMCNKVKLELQKAPPGKLFSVNALAEITNMDPHTVKRCIEEDLGEELDGRLTRTTTDGMAIFFLDPLACEALIDVERKAREEGYLELAEELEAIRRKYCST